MSHFKNTSLPALSRWKTLITASALVFAATGCNTNQHRVGVEGRFVTAEAEEGNYQSADQLVGGGFSVLTMPIQGADASWGWELGVGQSSDSFNPPGGEYTVQEQDAWLGARYNFMDGHIRPFLAGGIQYSQHEIELSFGGAKSVRTTDDMAPYGEAGMRVRLNRELHMVGGYRQSFGLDGSLGPLGLDLDTKRVFFGIGWSF